MATKRGTTVLQLCVMCHMALKYSVETIDRSITETKNGFMLNKLVTGAVWKVINCKLIPLRCLFVTIIGQVPRMKCILHKQL